MVANPELSGQVWFDFRNPQVWMFYRFVRSAASAGIAVSLDWQPLPTAGQEHLMTAQASLTEPVDRGRFLHAVLGRVHIEGDDPSDPGTVASAAQAAGVVVPNGADPAVLAVLEERAASIGVAATPSLYRHGSPLHIVLTGAALMDDPAATVQTIISTADDDGIWELRKP